MNEGKERSTALGGWNQSMFDRTGVVLQQVVRLFGGIRSETLDFISSYSLTLPVTCFSLALFTSECFRGVIEGMSQRTPLFVSHAEGQC